MPLQPEKWLMNSTKIFFIFFSNLSDTEVDINEAIRQPPPDTNLNSSTTYLTPCLLQQLTYLASPLLKTLTGNLTLLLLLNHLSAPLESSLRLFLVAVPLTTRVAVIITLVNLSFPFFNNNGDNSKAQQNHDKKCQLSRCSQKEIISKK